METPYDATKVKDFIRRIEENKDMPLSFVKSVFQLDSNKHILMSLLEVFYYKLTNWERANVLYGIQDLVAGDVKKLAKVYEKSAREQDSK
jgi:hypothetical protein